MNGRNVFLNMTRISFIILPANMMRCIRVHMHLRVKISLSILEKTTECFVQYNKEWNQDKKDNEILNYHVFSYNQIDNCININ